MLTRAGIGTGRDFSDVVAFLPPELFTPHILWRCLPGLSEHWKRFQHLVADALRRLGTPLLRDSDIAVYSPLVNSDDLPSLIECVEISVEALWWHEITAIRPLAKARQRYFDLLVATGELAREFINSKATGKADDIGFQRWLMKVIDSGWPQIQPFVHGRPASTASWRAALVHLGETGVADTGLPPDLTAEEADELRAVLRRAEAALRLLTNQSLDALAQTLVAGNRSRRARIALADSDDVTADAVIARASAARNVLSS